MTFVIKSRSNRRPVAGFTLVELLLVIGIIGLLAGLLLPAVSRAWGSAQRTRAAADFQAIATALEVYKTDWGMYPPVTSRSTGAAVLGKALIGAGDEAHYFTGSGAGRAPIDTLQNKPVGFDSTKTYQAGDVVLVGNAPQYPEFIAGRQSPSPIWNVFVCLRNDTDGTTHAPTGSTNDFWWTPFLPYDGADGPGSRIRLGAVTDANDAPHAAAGKVYGPYLDPERFRTNGPVILDRWGSPILYFPVNKAAVPTQANGYVNVLSYPRNTTEVLSAINADDNRDFFAREPITAPATERDNALARIKIVLGDYNNNGGRDGTEQPTPSTPFLLWSAGPDRVFGPRGLESTMSGSYSARAQDFYKDATHAAENATTAANVDDVTNFR